ncbi:mitochondrial fission factor-like isoform X2 [Acipenser ruthenus]|uniref:mitochondrial fission factor-like isoform X2 n=1 Tax=Acipenser ruthenus TaxID=7906 RepID=UPI00145A9506|nr:mitochondrial fission factor-like isoform X2 [Acipenser ruthenus]
MNGAAFPSPTAEMAEINRIQYEIDYTAGISQSMRIPEKLKIASSGGEARQGGSGDAHFPNAMMQVPERIVVSGDHEDGQYSRPRDLDLIQSTPLESLALKTPPRVLTLTERPLDFLDLERSMTQTPQNEEACIEEVRTQGNVKKERCMSENAVRQNGQMVRNDSIVAPSTLIQPRLYPPLTSVDDGRNLYSARGVLSLIQSTTRRAYQQVMEVLDENHRRSGLSTLDSTLEGTSDDLPVVDATSLRRQIIKLNRRLQLLEEDNKERGKREMVMYSITVAFWLINSWMWFRR